MQFTVQVSLPGHRAGEKGRDRSGEQMQDIQHSKQGRSSADNHEPKYRVLRSLIFPLSEHGPLRVRQLPL